MSVEVGGSVLNPKPLFLQPFALHDKDPGADIFALSAEIGHGTEGDVQGLLLASGWLAIRA